MALDLDGQQDAINEGLELVKDLRKVFKDLRIEHFGGHLDDMASQLEIMQVVVECKLNNETRRMNDELNREYERGLL